MRLSFIFLSLVFFCLSLTFYPPTVLGHGTEVANTFALGTPNYHHQRSIGVYVADCFCQM